MQLRHWGILLTILGTVFLAFSVKTKPGYEEKDPVLKDWHKKAQCLNCIYLLFSGQVRPVTNQNYSINQQSQVQAVVDNPEQVQINQVEGTQTVVLELRVAKEDMGRVIGKQGRMANAIRVLLNAASGKTRKRHVLEIVD